MLGPAFPQSPMRLRQHRHFLDRTTHLFGFGVYDGKNAMGSHYEPRHALTYDDAGKMLMPHQQLRLRSTQRGTLVPVIPAHLCHPCFPGGGRFIRSHRDSGSYVRRNAGLIPGLPITSSVPVQAPPALVDIAMRGGINKIQFQEQQFDSFLGINFTATTLNGPTCL